MFLTWEGYVMSIKRILVLSLAATALSTAAWANDTYQCGESRCYDDQADETRRLNLMQLENPGAGLDAVPGRDDADASYNDPDDSSYADENDDGEVNGQGGPYDPYDPDDDADSDSYGPPPGAYPPPPDDSYAPDDAAPPDTGAYPDDNDDSGYLDDDDDGPYPDDDE
jgi:hypothetical protein